MTARQLGISRWSIAVSAVLVGVVSLGIGAYAALNKPALDTAMASQLSGAAIRRRSLRGSHWSSATVTIPTPTRR